MAEGEKIIGIDLGTTNSVVAVMSHALESLTARAYPRRLNPAKGVLRPVSQGANPFSDMPTFARSRLISTPGARMFSPSSVTSPTARCPG